jgi:hypothetical protein
MIQRTNVTKKECFNEKSYNERSYNERCYNERSYNERAYSERCYKERCYNERILQRKMLLRTVFINQITMLQRTRKNTIGRRSTRVPMPCRAFPPWLERQSSSLLSFVRFSYQFSSVICLYAPLVVKIFLKSFRYIILAISLQNRVCWMATFL